MEYMTKKCGNCGHAGLDDQAQFCNRCGAAVPEEKRPSFPVCPGCGTVVSDELAQFCNRCGTKIQPLPVTCRTCGNPAIDTQSRFCTRCGTTFEQKPVIRKNTCPSCGAPDPHGASLFCNRCGAQFSRQGTQAAHPQPGTPVLVTQKRPAEPHPTLMVPDTDWEPWNEVPPALGISRSEPPIPQKPIFHDEKAAVREKRYAHLPLIAEDMKKRAEPLSSPHAQDIQRMPGKKKQVSQKKGVLGFLKKE
jgi:DNA-directed RNA polymerase subunit RPC12/RpoP